MAKQMLKKGDKVQWSAGQGTATGTVEDYITEDQKVKGKKISASQANPRYLVKNDKTESVTAHSPDALSKANSETRSEKTSSEKSSSKKGGSRELDSEKPSSTRSNAKKSDSAKSSAEKSSDAKSSAAKSSSEKERRFEEGDRVQWDSRQGQVEGVVEKKLTSKTKIKGYTAKASKDEPQYLVKSDRTGSEAAHKPDALEPLD